MKKIIFKMIAAKLDLIVLSFLLLGGIIIGWNRVWYLGRINFADDFIWGSRWDRVLVGQLPYRDFFELYGPGFPIFLAPLYEFLGRGLPAIRIIHYLIFPSLNLFVLFVLLGQLGLREWKRALAIGFLSLIFMGMAWLDLPWSFRTWLGIFGVLLIKKSYESKNIKKPFLAGIATVVIGLFSTEQGVAVLAAGLVGGIYRSLKSPKELKLVEVFLFGVLAATGLSAWLMWRSDMLFPYLETAFWHVPFYQNAAYGLIFPTEDIFKDPLKFGWFLPFIIWGFCAVFWGVNQLKDRHYKKRANSQVLILMLLVLGLFGLRIYLGRTEWGHFAVDNIATWLIGIWVVSKLRYTENTKRLGKKVVIGVVFVGIITISWIATARLNPYWKSLMSRAVKPDSFKSRLVYLPSAKVWLFPEEAQDLKSVLEYASKNIPKDQEIYPFPVISGLSNLLGRITPNYFEQAWFATSIIDQEKLVREIENRQAPWVIYSERDYVIKLDRAAQVYILKTYQPVARFGPYKVMKRNKNWTEVELGKFFLTNSELSNNQKGLRDTKPNNDHWLITGDNPTWEVNQVVPANIFPSKGTLVLRYQLGFTPGLASFSKTVLEIKRQNSNEDDIKILYKEPFLLPGPPAGGWQEAWIEVPLNFNPQKFTVSLAWPGAFNPRAKWVQWGR